MKIKLDAKHVLSVVAVLALIGGGAGALIGTVNYFTAEIIGENNDRKENEAYYACFPDAASFGDETEVSSGTYIETYKSALDGSGNEIGKVYHAVGATGFGATVDLLIGVNGDGLAHIEIVAYGPDNTGGNGATVEAWIDSINGGDATIDGGTTTGATNTASVVREMVAEALDLYENGDVPDVPPGPIDEVPPEYAACFPDAASFGDEVAVDGNYISSYAPALDASGSEIGRCYVTKSTPVATFGSLTAVIGVNADGTIAHVEVTENTQSIPGSTDDYAEYINGGGNYAEVPDYDASGTIGVTTRRCPIMMQAAPSASASSAR